MKKINIIVITIFFLCFTLSSCSSGSDNEKKSTGPVTITFSTFLEDGSQADAYRDIIKKFEESNSGIKVDLQSGANGYNDKIKNSLEKGNGPDIIGLQRSSMLDYIKQGSLKDLTSWVESSGLKEKLYGVCTGYGKSASKYYGIGDLPYTVEWFYNTDMFKKAKINQPQNLDDLISVCSKLQKYSQSPLALGAKNPWALDIFFGMITSQTVDTGELSGAYLSGSKDSYANLKGMDDAMNIFSKLTNPWSVYKNSLDNDYSNSIDDFVKGKAAILPMGSWAVDKINDVKPKSFKYGVFENPVKFSQTPNSLYSATAIQVITVN
jgi:ABC-type glycerol-3-phosphate transport system substrate-binding protein